MMKVDAAAHAMSFLIDINESLKRASAMADAHGDFPERDQGGVIHTIEEAFAIAAEGLSGMSQD
jgi:hypothetical protein